MKKRIEKNILLTLILMMPGLVIGNDDLKGLESNHSVSQPYPSTSDVSPLTFIVGTGGKHRPPMNIELIIAGNGNQGGPPLL